MTHGIARGAAPAPCRHSFASRAAPAALSEVTGQAVDRGAAYDGELGRTRGCEGRCCTYRCCGRLIFPACQACSGELMSHNTVKNIVANKGNIDYCIEVRQLCLPAPRCPAAPPTSLSVRRTRATCSTICALSLVLSRVLIRRRRAPTASCPGQAVGREVSPCG